MIFILGAHGFVGSAFVRYCVRHKLEHAAIDLDNYHRFIGKRSEVLLNANGNSKKYLADQSPVEDFDMNVRGTLCSLLDFPTNTYVYLSTIDVYNDVSNSANNREDVFIDPCRLSRYGMGKYMAELLVRRYAERWLILRLGGMVGPGLKKNSVYDLLNGIPLRVHPKSAYQYLHVDDVARITMLLVNRQIAGEVFNLCGDGVIHLSEIQTRLGLLSSDNELEIQHYEVNVDRIKRFTPVPGTRATVMEFITNDHF